MHQVGVTLAPHEFSGYVRKPRKGGIQRIKPKRYTSRCTAFLPYRLPSSGAQHLAFIVICDDGATFLTDVNGSLCSVCFLRNVELARPFQAAELQFDKFAAMRARNEVMLFDGGCLFSLPNVPRFQRWGGGHEYLAIEKCLRSLSCERHWIGLFFRCSRELIDLIEKQIFDRFARKICRAICAGQIQPHVPEFQGELFALAFTEFLRGGLIAFYHRDQASFARRFRQVVRRINHHGGGRVLVNQAADHVFHCCCAAHLSGLNEHDFFDYIVGKGIHDLYQIRRDIVVPWPRYGPTGQSAVFCRPL